MTAKIDATNINGQTALHVACLNRDEDIVHHLIQAGADCYSRNAHGCCPSHLAAQGGSLACLKIIICKGIDLGCAKYLECKGMYGNSVLHYAVQNGHVEMTKYLIKEAGFDVNERNDLTETPLHLAAGGYFKSNGSEILQLLLDAGSDLNSTTAWGDTAAHYAALSGTLANLQFLIEAGCTVSKNPDLGHEAAKLCRRFNLSKASLIVSFYQPASAGRNCHCLSQPSSAGRSFCYRSSLWSLKVGLRGDFELQFAAKSGPIGVHQ